MVGDYFVFVVVQPAISGVRPFCLAHSAVSKPTDRDGVDRSAGSVCVVFENPIFSGANSSVVVFGAIDRPHRLGNFVGAVLFARRAGAGLVVGFLD